MDTLQDAPIEAQTASDSTAPNNFAELDDIQSELLRLVGHLQLVDQRLWANFSELPTEYQPAATVLHDATMALDALHTRVDQLNVRMADLKHGPGWRERLRAECSADGETVQ